MVHTEVDKSDNNRKNLHNGILKRKMIEPNKLRQQVVQTKAKPGYTSTRLPPLKTRKLPEVKEPKSSETLDDKRSFVPESFRWLIAKRKFERAEKLINFVANVNRVPKPDLKSLFATAMKETITTSKPTAGYTIFTLWSSKELRIVTLALSAVWFAISITWYSIALGMESISVDIFWTMFLINLVDVPAFSVTGPLLNRFGRRKYCFVTFAASSILCCVSGVFQHFDKLSQNSASLTVTALVLSLLAKMTVTAADTAVIVYTAELYPTDVRTTGCGFQGTVGRLGAIAAPLLVHLDGIYPGSMYFTCGMLLFLSTGSILRLKETKDDILQDSVINTLDPGDG
ncbi:solute carrier family 22 member 7-like [Mercenaria mercenaria]|uniref:solute carrier family 22 member 7-like n=1 Tax=Mercenaria mercenaria TaxID=6596 RepID=UPI00234EF1C2|nr:solute carrier family 22 member 7-like [Mercenaria mercenaria]